MAHNSQTSVSELPHQEQTALFIDCLHGNNNGYINVSHKGKNGIGWHNSYIHLGYQSILSNIQRKYDSYISVNCFDSATHKSDHCSLLNGFYIDIDILHNSREFDIDTSDLLIGNCLTILEDKIAKQELAEPTIIVLSGRGLAIYYLYKQPICTAQKDAVLFHDTLYKRLITVFQTLINTQDIEVDTKIKDKSRVCRLPGTYNSKAGRFATLYKLNSDTKYDFARLCTLTGIDIHDLLCVQEAPAIPAHPETIVTLSNEHTKRTGVQKPFESSAYFSKQAKDVARSRINWLKKLAIFRTFSEGTGRNELIFITYCHLKQLFSIKESRKRIYEFNQLLAIPIPPDELFILLDSVDTHLGSNGINGTYVFSNDTLKNLLSLTLDEIKELGIDKNKDIQRQRKLNLQNAEERDRLVCKLFLEGMSHKQIVNELSSQYSCSLKTVKRITLRYGLDASRSKAFEDIDFHNNRIYSRHRSYDPEKGSTFTIQGEGEEDGEGFTPPPSIQNSSTGNLDRLLSGKNAFITGDAGCGKTYLLKQFICAMHEQNKTVLITAPTNKAADNINGQTIHKAFHLEARTYSDEDSLDVDAFLSLENIDAVIVDEISMVPSDIFQQMVRIICFAESFYNKHIQIVVCGDFYQLPPVNDSDASMESVPYLFESPLWETLGFNREVIYLNTAYRQFSDPLLSENLNKIKHGDTSALTYFNTKVNSAYRFSEYAIHLCAYRKDVEKINQICISRHKKDSSYTTICWEPCNKSTGNEITSFSAYIGMPVIVTDNTAFAHKGTLGQVSDISNNSVTIILSNGETLNIEPTIFPLERGNYIRKMPVEPAYAITIHKAQGMTLDKAIIHPNCFAEGQLYTALSRVKSKNGLILSAPIKADDVLVSSKVLQFYSNLKTNTL